MAWLKRAAASAGRGALRGTGSFLSSHVLPDTVIPSWKTQQRVGRATKAVGSFLKPKSKKRRTLPNKSSKPSKKPSTYSPRPASTARPQRGGLPTYDRNGWQRGDALRSVDFSPSRSANSSVRAMPPKVRQKVQRLQAQARDILLNPRAVGRMVWDELKFDASRKKKQLLSRFNRAR